MLICKLLQSSFNDHLSHPVSYRREAQSSHCSIGLWNLLLSYCRGVIASACKPVPYRVKVFPWIAFYGFDGNTIYTRAFATCFHLFESFPDIRPIDRIPLLLLFKNHPQFSLSCNTKRNYSCEALRSFPVSGNIITTTTSSAPERNIGISDLPFGFSSFSLFISFQVLLFRKHARIEFLPSKCRIPCKQ